MADTLFSSAEAKAQLDSGVVAKLVKAAEASSLLTVCRSLEALTVGVKSHVTFFRRKERRSATSIELLAIDGAVNRNTNHNHTLPD